MTAPLSLDHIRSLHAGITPGPWERPLNTRYKASVTAEMPKGDPASRFRDNTDHEGNPERVTIVSVPMWSSGKFFRKQSGKDLAFIAAAPSMVAHLLGIVERVEKARQELFDLSNDDNWNSLHRAAYRDASRAIHAAITGEGVA